MTLYNTIKKHVRIVGLMLLTLNIAVSTFAADYVTKMKRKSGVYTIECEVNGVKRDFIIDTGAAKTSLSQEFVNELLAKRRLTRNDFTGTTQTRNASGVIDNNATVVIRQLRVGNRILHNTQAIVAVSAKAPLLLGLNALDLLGEWSMKKGYFILHDDKVSFGVNEDEYYDDSHDEAFIDSEEQQGYVSGNAPLASDRLKAYRGDAESQYILGKCYLDGNGVDSDPKIAVVWFKLAAEQGHQLAQMALADCYTNGWGVNVDETQAKYWRHKAMKDIEEDDDDDGEKDDEKDDKNE